MLQLGKVQLLGEEMMRLGVDICGLSEVRWDEQWHFTTLDGHTIVQVAQQNKPDYSIFQLNLRKFA